MVVHWQYRFCSIIVGGSYICFLGQGRFIQLADWLTTLFQRMWHLRSNYKRSFLWLLVSPRKSPLLKLNLQSHEKISSSPLLVCQPTSCSSASPMQCLKSLGVPLWGVYWDRCNRDGCYFGCWLIRFQRSFLLLTNLLTFAAGCSFFFSRDNFKCSVNGEFLVLPTVTVLACNDLWSPAE